MVHVFAEKARRYYELERLWKSAKRLEPADLKAAPKRIEKNALPWLRQEKESLAFGRISFNPRHPERSEALAERGRDPASLYPTTDSSNSLITEQIGSAGPFKISLKPHGTP